ncbi:Na+/H+ antiporter subunit E [Sinimarinibacterium sp. NLF-5-8]|uniref:Na+/H+ antiporter subunit E n=1 Tax=Sinimarinibacterium sp. NLF-5-8 TaxID=2698684 RepID=UPI00192E8D92|nr:Na+/H+ antiporter subunit E [Sinimarinibacterium sp. NLF-5-8]
MMARIRRVVALPVLLLLLWLLLNHSWAVEQWVLGGLLAVLAAVFSSRMRPQRARLRKPWVALRLLAVVLWDMAVSNLVVARVILGRAERRRRAQMVEIPLALRDPHGLTVLSMIITCIPGTVWADLSDDGARLTLHVLEMREDADWPQFIKTRYEAALMEIFE